MTKEEAEAKLVELQWAYEMPFCPLIHTACHTNCVCHEHGHVRRQSIIKGIENWVVAEPCCGNAMFHEHELTVSY